VTTATNPASGNPIPTGPAAPSSRVVLAKAVVKNWKTPVALGIIAVIGVVLFWILGRDGETTFSLSGSGDAIQLAPLVLPVRPTGIVVSILLVLIAAYSTWLVYRARKVPLWLIIVFAILTVLAFLVWALAGATEPLAGLFIGTVGLSVPLIFGALGGVISEHVGVVNVAIEGQLLAGAFLSAVVASMTGQPLLGLIAAMVGGVLVSFVLAAFSIKYLVDQVIVGVVLNVLVLGLTNFLYSEVLSPNAHALNSPERFGRIKIPLLGDIPVIGPVLFQQTIIVYLMYIAVFVVWYGLFHTKWGLRLRASGEHPQAADTVGIRVNLSRFWNVSLAGAIVGLGGAYFTLGSNGGFTKDVTGGYGFIALAAVIFGRWDPVRATLAALLFGFATNLQSVFGVIGSPVPSEFLLMLPYIVTIFAVAGLVGQVKAPAAEGKPYVKS